MAEVMDSEAVNIKRHYLQELLSESELSSISTEITEKINDFIACKYANVSSDICEVTDKNEQGNLIFCNLTFLLMIIFF